MKPTIRIVTTASLLVCLVFAQARAQDIPPIGIENLISSIGLARDQHKRIESLIDLIKLHGVSFELKPDTERRIRAASRHLSEKSLNDLIAVLRDNYRPPNGSKTTQDIMAFIKGKISDNEFGYQVPLNLTSLKYDNVEVGQCKLSWQEKKTLKWNVGSRPATSQTITIEVNLSDIAPEQIRVEHVEHLKGSKTDVDLWSIIMPTTHSEKKIRFTYFDTTNFGSAIDITFIDKELAQRLSQALKDWVKRCGGKSEPY